MCVYECLCVIGTVKYISPFMLCCRAQIFMLEIDVVAFSWRCFLHLLYKHENGGGVAEEERDIDDKLVSLLIVLE